MAKKKVYVNVLTRLVIECGENLDVEQILSDMDYSFTSQTPNAKIIDTEIVQHEVTKKTLFDNK